MPRSVKSEQLQLRVSRPEKAAIARAASAAGMDMSAYVLSRVLPAAATTFRELAALCAGPEPRYALAELNTFLTGLTAGELRDAVAAPPRLGLTPYFLNYLTAMVEEACARRAIPVPLWTSTVPPLADPVFGSSLESLRLHLLTHSPPPFRLRNIFIDSSLGERV